MIKLKLYNQKLINFINKKIFPLKILQWQWHSNHLDHRCDSSSNFKIFHCGTSFFPLNLWENYQKLLKVHRTDIECYFPVILLFLTFFIQCLTLSYRLFTFRFFLLPFVSSKSHLKSSFHSINLLHFTSSCHLENIIIIIFYSKTKKWNLFGYHSNIIFYHHYGFYYYFFYK